MTLSKHDKIVYGGDDSTSGQYILAEILSVEKQEGGPTWFRLQHLVNLTSNILLDETVRKNAQYFAEVGTLDIIPEEQATRYISNVRQSPIIEQAVAVAQGRDEVMMEETEDEVTAEEPEDQIANYPENSMDIFPKLDIPGLSTGYFRNLVVSLNYVPEQAVASFDLILSKVKHEVADFMTKSELELLIDKKINSVVRFEKIILEVGRLYEFKNEEENFYLYNLGDHLWFDPKKYLTDKNLVKIDINFFEKFTTVESNNDAVVEDCIEDIKKAFQKYAGPNIMIKHIAAEPKNNVSEEDLGEGWASLITCYYFKHSGKIFDKLDLTTFKNYPMIKEILEENEELCSA
jgi:hypothetical protein